MKYMCTKEFGISKSIEVKSERMLSRSSTSEIRESNDKFVGLIFISIAYMLNYIDRQMLSILIEPIKREMGLPDAQIGLLSGTLFALFYTLFSIPIAVIADRARRIPLISIACFVWSLFTGLSGLAVTFVYLAIARIGVAVGEAGGLSPSLSLISDYFPPQTSPHYS